MDGARTLFGRLCVFGPLLYIGLAMAMDPAGFVTCSAMLGRVSRTFHHRLHGLHWQEPLWEPDSVGVSGKTLLAVRLAGLALAACAFLIIAGFAN